jgi:CheY-like chemotaxis protein
MTQGERDDLALVAALMAGVAHDFNNLLMVMGSCAHFLKSAPDLSPSAHGDAALLDEAVRRAAALTERLAAFGRRSAQRVTRVDLGATATEIEKILRRLAGEDIAVVATGARGLMVRADVVRIEQLILCAGVAARRLLPRGGTLSVEVAESAQGAVLAISLGARPGEQPAAGPFPALPVMTEIAAEAGGVLVVAESERGLTVTVTLPLAEEVDGAEAPRPAGGTETVLLVEDDDGTRNILRRVLSSAGYQVLSAADVADAVRIADREPAISLVFTDVVLPDGSGMDLVQRLAGRSPQVRVLLSSGYPDSVLASYGVPDQGVQRLAKPFTSAELLAAVRSALDGKAA